MFCCVAVGQSVDPSAITMVDSVKVYTKTKEVFGWPDDSDDSSDSTTGKTPPTSNGSSVDPPTDNSAGNPASNATPVTFADRLIDLKHL